MGDDRWNPIIELAEALDNAEPVPFWKFLLFLALFILGVMFGTWFFTVLMFSLYTPAFPVYL